MIRGDSKEGWKYRDLIIKQIDSELELSKDQRENIISKLNNAHSDELERLYEAFERFGVQVILDIVKSDRIQIL